MANIPHFDLPFRFAGQTGMVKAVEVEQDTVDDIVVCVEALLRTRPGQRIDLPTYGVPDPVFQNAEPDDLLAAIQEWEPRANIAIQEGWDYDQFIQTIRIIVNQEEGTVG